MILLKMYLLVDRLYLSVFHYAFQTCWGIHFSATWFVDINELVLWLHEIDFGCFAFANEGTAQVNVRLSEVVLNRRLIELNVFDALLACDYSHVVQNAFLSMICWIDFETVV